MGEFRDSLGVSRRRSRAIFRMSPFVCSSSWSLTREQSYLDYVQVQDVP